MYNIYWYHWFVFRLFRKIWQPILSSRPSMIYLMKDWLAVWLADIEQQSQQQRKQP
jgi:hypothetical protein